jgi:hypothetical protein
MRASIGDNTKKKRGRKVTTGKGTLIGVRLLSENLSALDGYIATQPEPRPSRPEAIRYAIRRLLTETLAKAPPLPEIGEQTDARPPPVDNANLDGVRRAITASVSEWRRDDPDIDDSTIAIYGEAANDLVANPDLDMKFGYWIQSELDKLVRRSEDQPTLKGLSGRAPSKRPA